MAIQKDTARISYRYTPRGEHKFRLLALRPLAKPKRNLLVYCGEVQGAKKRQRDAGPRAGFGAAPQPTSFTALAKNRVRDACAVLDKAFGKQCLFVTGTLPGSTREAMDAIAKWSGYLVSRLKQFLADNFPKMRHVIVWEFQQRGALHLHACLGSHSRRDLVVLRRTWKKYWIKCLDAVCDKSGVDLYAKEGGGTWATAKRFVRCDAQRVKKSVGRYLSKYLSKSAAVVSNSGYLCPSRWWGIDNWLRAEALRQTLCVLSPVQPYLVAREIFFTLMNEWMLVADKVFTWKNKYNPFERTFIVFMPDTA